MERGHLAAIEVEELQAGYGRTDVLDGIDLAVTAGEFVAILGSSACGKTTGSAAERRTGLTAKSGRQRACCSHPRLNLGSI